MKLSNPTTHATDKLTLSHNRPKPFPKPSHTLSAGRSLLPTPHVHIQLSFSDTRFRKPVIHGQESKSKTDINLKTDLQIYDMKD
jgi:hypothetical protein